MTRGLLFVLASILSLSANASVLWRGDFQTGDLSQWSGTETVDAGSRLKVTADPTGLAGKALRVLVHQGDNPIHASGNRNEVFYTDDDLPEGTERFYHWRTMWPEDYPSADVWQIFTQWHHYDGGGSPPLAFMVWGDNIQLGTNTGDMLWTTPLVRGQWHDFVFHVNWASDDRGFVELYYDGKLVLPKVNRATLFPHQGVYVKQGLYRSATVQADQVVYHRGMTVGTTLDDVWPSTKPATAPAVAPPPSGSGTVTSEGSTSSAVSSKVNGVASGCMTGSVDLLGLVVAASFFVRRRRK